MPNVIIAYGLHLELLDTQEILIQEHSCQLGPLETFALTHAIYLMKRGAFQAEKEMSIILRSSNYVTVPCILLGHCTNKYTVKILQDIKFLKINS